MGRHHCLLSWLQKVTSILLTTMCSVRSFRARSYSTSSSAFQLHPYSYTSSLHKVERNSNYLQAIALQHGKKHYHYFKNNIINSAAELCHVRPFLQYQHSPVLRYCSTKSRHSSSKDDNAHATEINESINAARNITKVDQKYISMALEYARRGKGFTYPNPAVGCVLVRSKKENPDDEGVVIGAGFHPKAGMPHAEIFALLQASGAVRDGVEAAASVLPNTKNLNTSTATLPKQVQDLLQIYLKDNGSQSLFGNCLTLVEDNLQLTCTTAYVTLEPCCHTGKRTPPCTMALVHAGVDRVVVGFRDPNPRVDGGGVMFLRSKDIQVDVLPEETKEAKACQTMVESFIKRIHQPKINYDDAVNGAHRSALRSLAGRKKRDKTLVEITLSSRKRNSKEWEVDWNNTKDLQYVMENIIPVHWLEEVDTALWNEELVLLRLGEVVPKKKLALLVGQSIAENLNAHVAQVVGHTVLLYRPGSPPKLNLNELIASSNSTM